MVSAILREMRQVEGSIKLAGSISYASQQAWITNCSLKDNIQFDMSVPLDEERYRKVLHACALLPDLVQLKDGDRTEIGERGINLSGGQKARVSIGRCIYRDADTYILDDPMSAVDSHVAEHIFNNVMTGFLNGKTRILVTNQLQFLQKADHIVVMDKGRIAEQGSFAQLMGSGAAFATLMTSHGGGATSDGHEQKEEQKNKDAKPGVEKDKNKGADKLMTEEERSVRSVDAGVYMYYFSACGVLPMIFIIIGLCGFQALRVAGDFWLSDWTTKYASTRGNVSTDDTNYYLSIYLAWGVGASICLLVRSFYTAVGRTNASQVLHERLFDRIIRAPMRFFDTTPVGRTLNRFSSDMNAIDTALAPALSQFIGTASQVFGSIIAIAYTTKGIFLVPLVPLLALYYTIQVFFRKTSTELQRLSSISLSPVYSHFSETLSGLSVIRAFGARDRFTHTSDRLMDENTRLFFSSITASDWLGLRLDFLGSLISFAVAAIVSIWTGIMPAGWAGLALTYSFEITGYLKHAVRMVADTESRMNAVERVQFYSNNIEQEGTREDTGDVDPIPKNWPSKGEVVIEKLYMEYKKGEPVLKNLSIIIPARSKVGIAGRTGSGKSTFMLGLLRLVEPASGQILIDGIDTQRITLRDLRSNVAIIPQDPVLFSDSLRRNIDPFDVVADDAEIWRVLGLVRLKDYVQELEGQLNYMVSEGGENFSVGQRQLICMARALVRKPKILLLDEATASIDVESDFLMQEMIRKNFHDITVITIAHRLKTIMDSDLILVLEQGNPVEFDSPARLLENQDGYLTAMAEAHGQQYAALLRGIAQGKLNFTYDENGVSRQTSDTERRSSVVRQEDLGEFQDKTLLLADTASTTEPRSIKVY